MKDAPAKSWTAPIQHERKMKKGEKKVEVKLLTSTASVEDMEKFAALAALTCHANAEKEYVPNEVLGRIIKAGHESILEHITLTYSVKGLSRACLQELARHRHISLSVESTRHTLRKYMKAFEEGKSLSMYLPVNRKLSLDNDAITFSAEKLSSMFIDCLMRVAIDCPEIPNDELKYYLPEFWPTNLILTSNIRELRHIIKLRTNPAALNEFRVLAYSLYEAVPEEYRYLLEDCVYK